MEAAADGADGSGDEGALQSLQPAAAAADVLQQHEATVTLTPVTLSHQEAFLRGHLTVLAADGTVVHQIEKSGDGEPTFCVQAVPATFSAADLTKAGTSAHAHQESAVTTAQYIDLAAYQLSGDVYKLVVREDKPPPQQQQQCLATDVDNTPPAIEQYSDVQLTAAQSLTCVHVLPRPAALSPPPDDEAPRAPPEPPSSPPAVDEPPAAAPGPPPCVAASREHCLICGMDLATRRSLSVYTHHTHQSETTYAQKLLQVAGHAADFPYHSEVICESCASLLNVVDSFEARLREISARLEDTRREVAEKFERTYQLFDSRDLPEPSELELVVSDLTSVKAPAQPPRKQKKRKFSEEAAQQRQPPQKRSRAKTADADYSESENISEPPRQEGSILRQRLLRRAVTERPPPALDDQSEDDEDEDDPAALNSCSAAADEQTAGDPAGGEPDDDSTAAHERRISRLLNRCPACDTVQDNLHVFRAHLVTHSGLSGDQVRDQLTQRPHERLGYGCSRCDHTFSTYREQQRHVRTRHPRFSRCAVCLTQVEQAPGLMESHLATHDQQNRCSFCALVAHSVPQLVTHTEQQHALALNSLYCELCRAFVDETAFAGHLRASHPEVPELSVQCRSCGEVMRRSAYRAHLRVHEAKFQCRFCARSFASSGLLVVHERSHTGERPFTCVHCGRCFVSKATMDSHLTNFHSVNEFKCSQCSRTFANEGMRRRHEVTHSKHKPHVCQVCQKGFNLETHLNQHVRAIHLGETPFECHVCQKHFPYKSSLKEHMHIHTGVKSFSCHTCLKRFRTAKILRSHELTHQKEKPYKCSVGSCSRSFSRKDLLARHRLGAHGIQPEVAYSRLQASGGRPPAPPPPAATHAPTLHLQPPAEVQFVVYQGAARSAAVSGRVPPPPPYPS